jgi:protein tyrosine/serine phosphatase
VPAHFTREEFETPAGRRRALNALMLGDHGLLRRLYDNSHEISPGKMWRTYQPSPRDLKRWRDKGVRTVVNLRGDAPTGYFLLEEDACARLSLRLRSFQVFSRDAPSKEVFHGARRLFEEIEYPAVMHCKSGSDRVGLMATLYLFLHEGRPLDVAMEQLSLRYGHVRQSKTGVIDYALEKFMAHAKSAGLATSSVDGFYRWVDVAYDPEATKAEFKARWWASALADNILRRE